MAPEEAPGGAEKLINVLLCCLGVKTPLPPAFEKDGMRYAELGLYTMEDANMAPPMDCCCCAVVVSEIA